MILEKYYSNNNFLVRCTILWPYMCSHTKTSEGTEVQQRVLSIQNNISNRRWNFERPTTTHHHLTAEMQLEKKLINQFNFWSVLQHVGQNGHLNGWCINIQFESDEIFFSRDVFNNSEGRIRRRSITRNGNIEKMIN